MQNTLGIDVETTKKPFMFPWQPEAYLVAVGITDQAGRRRTWVFNHNELDGEVNQRQLIDEIQREVNRATLLVGHNLKFDLNWLSHIGIDFRSCRLYCTQVAEYLIRAQRMGQLSLADLSEQYLTVNKIDRVKQFWDAGYETSEIPLKILLPYLEQDCINALAIYQKQQPVLQKLGLVKLAGLQCELSRVLSHIEMNGMPLNEETARRDAGVLMAELSALDKRIQLLLGWKCNLGSSDDLSVALYGGARKVEREVWVQKTLKTKPETLYTCKIEVDKVPSKGMGFVPLKNSELKKKGYWSTDKGTIKQLKAKTQEQRKLKKLLIERSKTDKALSMLVTETGKGVLNTLMPDGCVHGQYNQTVAKTGRLSSSKPNMQNLPRKGNSPIKRSVYSKLGRILNVDMSQLEWRGVAYLSQDPVMIREIKDGIDPHTVNAIAFLGAVEGTKAFDELRTAAKVATFRLIYGGSAYSFYMDSNMPSYSLKKWTLIVDRFYEKYRVLKQWQDSNISTVYLNQGVLVNPTGRRFQFFKGPKGYRPQQIKNFPVQSISTADVMPLAMCIIYKKLHKLGLKSKIIAQVHDSLVWDCSEAEVQLVAEMCVGVFRDMPQYIRKYFGLDWNVPLDGDAEVGLTYGTVEKYKVAA